MNYNQNMNMNTQPLNQGGNIMGYQMNNQMNQNMNMNNNMNANSNMSNQQNLFFITGKFGNRDIAKEDLNTFIAKLKSTDWTNNPIYQHGINVDVTTSLASNNSTQSQMNNQRKGNFDSLYLNVSSRLFEFDSYKNEIIERKQKNAEEIEMKRKEFLSKFFPKDMSDSGIDELLIKINADKSGFISKDPTLSIQMEKVLKYLNPPKPQQQPQPQPQPKQTLYQQQDSYQQGGYQQGGYDLFNQNNSNAPPSFYNQPSTNPPYVQPGPNIYGQPSTNPPYVQPGTNIYNQPNSNPQYAQPITNIYGLPATTQPMYARQGSLTQPGFGQPKNVNNQFTNPNPQNNFYGNPNLANPPYVNPNPPYARSNTNTYYK